MPHLQWINIVPWKSNRSDISIHLGKEALEHLLHHRQRTPTAYEAGGPLFSKQPGQHVKVDAAAGPFEEDKRTRHSYIPNRQATQSSIYRQHIDGLHFIGTWHTHPARNSVASRSDIRSIQNLFTKSDHRLEYYIMIIVGTGAALSTWEVAIQARFGREVLNFQD